MDRGNRGKIDGDYVAWQTSVRLQQHAMDPPRASDPEQGATSAEALYREDGEAFVRLAFKTFLDRPPGADELRDWLGELRAGTSKSAMAARLLYSPEAAQRPQPFQLEKARRLDRLCQLPVIGGVFNLAISLLSTPALKRALHGQHQTTTQAIAELRRELDQLKIHTENVNRAVIRDIVQGEALHDLDVQTLTRDLQGEVRSLRDRQKELEERLTAARGGSGGDDDEGFGIPVDDDFYIAFENHFRGAEADIRERLTYYLPVIGDRLQLPAEATAVVDIGCGRGEWIGLLRDNGFAVTGIDMNARNVAACREKHLNAIEADGIGWLRDSASQSCHLITAFHLIEHLTLAQLNSLLVESLRCLQPGGLVIFETPNPENLVTAAHRFYTDPSHRHPLPPDLMEFLLKYRGFVDVEIHRLHPAGDRFQEESAMAETLNSLLCGPQDYAVVARKPQ